MLRREDKDMLIGLGLLAGVVFVLTKLSREYAYATYLFSMKPIRRATAEEYQANPTRGKWVIDEKAPVYTFPKGARIGVVVRKEGTENAPIYHVRSTFKQNESAGKLFALPDSEDVRLYVTKKKFDSLPEELFA